MENQRLILFVALSIVLLLLWQAWQQDYGAKTPPEKPASPAASAPADVPKTTVGSGSPVPASPDNGASASLPALAHDQRLHVTTDVLEADIDTVGGDVRVADLLAYPVKVSEPTQPFRLLSDDPSHLFVAQSGLLGGDVPDHYAHYSAEQTTYRLMPGTNELSVPLHWNNGHGVSVTKTYLFHRKSYVINVDFDVVNDSTQEQHVSQYRQFQRIRVGKESAFINTYAGGAVSSAEDKYKKISFDEMAKADYSQTIKGGWAAMVQHYFVAAWIPAQDQLDHYYTKALGGDRYVLGLTSLPLAVPAHTNAHLDSRLYVGPKLQDHLQEVAPHLELTVDYGRLTFIAKPLFAVLKWIHSWAHNWGWAIIILTLFIKLAFYKLSETSYRSMANMRRMAPKLQQLKERYGDDRQRMSQAMMELYKKEKINPLGGCLPILVQVPVFISLYWVLLGSVELRQADFIFWIKDLSSKDPYYILPLIMGISMFIQQKLNPAPPDPLQAKVMSVLPVVFTLFFAFFPAGLVLYWVVNNLLSIAQQWYITHRVVRVTRT